MSVCDGGDACGWAAAFCSMLAFGTFGVPIKSEVPRSLDIDPLVFQTYKTSMCFITSWLILLYHDIDLTFTPWGIVSGLFWVPGGIGTIYAVQNAGLAIGIGINSSAIVLVSFVWGIFIFEEHIHSRYKACIAVGFMMLGILGMAYYSDPSKQQQQIQMEDASSYSNNNNNNNNHSAAEEGEDGCDYAPLASDDEEDVEEEAISNNGFIVLDGESCSINNPEESYQQEEAVMSSSSSNEEETITCFKMKLQRRTSGILCAVCAGTYGGSIMVPMKWAPDDAKGVEYLISFAIGASIVTISIWFIRFLYLLSIKRNCSSAYQALPSLHLKKMWPYGCTCGLFWSIGNIFSILSVEYLGEGVGYSVVQSAILVSGLWGIFYFREIRGAKTISCWLISASVTVYGILLLSYEHHEK